MSDTLDHLHTTPVTDAPLPGVGAAASTSEGDEQKEAVTRVLVADEKAHAVVALPRRTRRRQQHLRRGIDLEPESPVLEVDEPGHSQDGGHQDEGQNRQGPHRDQCEQAPQDPITQA